jgi:hypothetical protein
MFRVRNICYFLLKVFVGDVRVNCLTGVFVRRFLLDTDGLLLLYSPYMN